MNANHAPSGEKAAVSPTTLTPETIASVSAMLGSGVTIGLADGATDGVADGVGSADVLGVGPGVAGAVADGLDEDGRLARPAGVGLAVGVGVGVGVAVGFGGRQRDDEHRVGALLIRADDHGLVADRRLGDRFRPDAEVDGLRLLVDHRGAVGLAIRRTDLVDRSHVVGQRAVRGRPHPARPNPPPQRSVSVRA